MGLFFSPPVPLPLFFSTSRHQMLPSIDDINQQRLNSPRSRRGHKKARTRETHAQRKTTPPPTKQRLWKKRSPKVLPPNHETERKHHPSVRLPDSSLCFALEGSRALKPHPATESAQTKQASQRAKTAVARHPIKLLPTTSLRCRYHHHHRHRCRRRRCFPDPVPAGVRCRTGA